MATYYLYFPFLTCEGKCDAAALDVADQQNTHSMTLAVRAVVDLFRLVKRDKGLDREILAFSISHDHRSVRMYSHYPVIETTKTTFTDTSNPRVQFHRARRKGLVDCTQIHEKRISDLDADSFQETVLCH